MSITEIKSQTAPENGAAPSTAAVSIPERALPKERMAAGRAKRAEVPRSAHATWQPASGRADPVALLEESNRTRLQELVPIRYGRMLISPFTYLRGSPTVMTHDLATLPTTGIRIQICGDAHLMNFGLYASPERNLLFDINDFDETLPGPWEWDVKRLTVSFAVSARAHNFRDRDAKDAARACARSYRRHIREYSQMPLLDAWYSKVDADMALKVFCRTERKAVADQMTKARQHNRLQALAKLTVVDNGQLRIVDDPPLVQDVSHDGFDEMLRRLFRGYYASLSDDRRTLVERYRFVDFAHKVVGVGSVGTRCYIVLLDAGHSADPLLLQLKQAEASIAEPFAGKSAYHNHGRRVVAGQRLMQSASDIFLGWSSEGEHDYYFRQLRDMKGSADVGSMTASDLADYAVLCGWVLARAHARSGDAAPIAGYLGNGEAFDEAAATFAMAYADQNDRDYAALEAAARSGRIQVDTSSTK